jgi:predicted flap endonuclease-1-like 5' DNA nuclease
MVAFFLQTLLLMAAAYLLGCLTACLVRRSLYAPRHRPAERYVEPLPEVLARGDVRFADTVAPPAPREVVPAPLVRPAATPDAVPAPAAQTVTAAAAAASAATSAAVAAAPAAIQAQDLKRIRLIDAAMEAALNKLGVIRYEQIAAWTRADVQRISQELGIKGRINQENWIEQAAILAKGGETYYSARRARGETATAAPTAGNVASPAPPDAGGLPRPMSRVGVAAAVVAAPTPQALPPTSPQVAERAAFAAPGVEPAAAVPIRPAPPAGHDNLQRIGNVTAEVEQALNASGITRYAQIAQWSPADVERFEKQLLASGRISRENWIEQAQILSRGGDTRFSREFDTRSGASVQRPNGGAAARRTDLGALRSVRSPAFRDAPEPGPEAAERLAAQNKVPRATDDLKRLRGVGVLIEKKLNGMGISSYEQIANWTADDIDRVSRLLDFKGRIERENWVEQARILSAGGQTEFSRRVDRGEVETSRAKT